jgi:tartrate dehydrogenase/decarboxylase/D-malate dehydrogenase
MRDALRRYGIAAIPGDGIGLEAIAAGLRVLVALAKQEGSLRLDRGPS